VINENGKIFCDFCASNEVVIGRTLFPHKKSHRLTWRTPDGTSEKKIDHVAISRSLQDSRVKYNVDVGSNRLLVVAEVKMKLLALKKPSSTRRKYCTYRFRDQSVRYEFVIELAKRQDAICNGSDDEEEVELDAEQE